MLQNTARILLQRQGGDDKLEQNLHRKRLNKCNNNKVRVILALRRTHRKRKSNLGVPIYDQTPSWTSLKKQWWVPSMRSHPNFANPASSCQSTCSNLSIASPG